MNKNMIMKRTDIVAQVGAFIDEHYAEGIGVADVARAVHYSPSHLTSLIRRITGRPVSAWIIARRIAAARERLLTSDESVTTIGASVGFRDVAYFIRRFSRAHGTAPGRWRKSNAPSLPQIAHCPACGLAKIPDYEAS